MVVPVEQVLQLQFQAHQQLTQVAAAEVQTLVLQVEEVQVVQAAQAVAEQEVIQVHKTEQQVQPTQVAVAEAEAVLNQLVVVMQAVQAL